MVLGVERMNWVKILKRGKLLTLPKTQLRIKTPEKGETDDTCNRKLEEYANKVKGLTMHFRDYWESGGKDSQWAAHLELNSDTKNQYGEHFELGVSTLKDSVTEPIEWGRVGWGFIEGKVWEYRKVPEEVACAALDLLKEISNSMGASKNKKTIDVGKWKIRCSSYESTMHSSLKLVIIGPNLSSGTVSSVLVDIDVYIIADVDAFKNLKRLKGRWGDVYEAFNYQKWREQVNWAK